MPLRSPAFALPRKVTLLLTARSPENRMDCGRTDGLGSLSADRKEMIDMKKTDYIAVFDSGLGGLSVLRQLKKQLPGENFLYFGDSANAPYGERTKENIQELCADVVGRLKTRGIKCVVIACNTATSAALEYLQERFPETGFIGIEPAVRWAAEELDHPRVLTFATNFTVSGEKYLNSVKELEGKGTFDAIGAPGFVQAVEKGITDATMTEDCRAYIDQLITEKQPGGPVDAVVLGCTHFPFIGETIREETDRLTGGHARVFDAAVLVARRTRDFLKEAGCLNESGGGGKTELLNSDPSKLPMMKKLLDVQDFRTAGEE